MHPRHEVARTLCVRSEWVHAERDRQGEGGHVQTSAALQGVHIPARDALDRQEIRDPQLSGRSALICVLRGQSSLEWDVPGVPTDGGQGPQDGEGRWSTQQRGVHDSVNLDEEEEERRNPSLSCTRWIFVLFGFA